MQNVLKKWTFVPRNMTHNHGSVGICRLNTGSTECCGLRNMIMLGSDCETLCDFWKVAFTHSDTANNDWIALQMKSSLLKSFLSLNRRTRSKGFWPLGTFKCLGVWLSVSTTVSQKPTGTTILFSSSAAQEIQAFFVEDLWGNLTPNRDKLVWKKRFFASTFRVRPTRRVFPGSGLSVQCHDMCCSAPASWHLVSEWSWLWEQGFNFWGLDLQRSHTLPKQWFHRKPADSLWFLPEASSFPLKCFSPLKCIWVLLQLPCKNLKDEFQERVEAPRWDTVRTEGNGQNLDPFWGAPDLWRSDFREMRLPVDLSSVLWPSGVLTARNNHHRRRRLKSFTKHIRPEWNSPTLVFLRATGKHFTECWFVLIGMHPRFVPNSCEHPCVSIAAWCTAEGSAVRNTVDLRIPGEVSLSLALPTSLEKQISLDPSENAGISTAEWLLRAPSDWLKLDCSEAFRSWAFRAVEWDGRPSLSLHTSPTSASPPLGTAIQTRSVGGCSTHTTPNVSVGILYGHNLSEWTQTFNTKKTNTLQNFELFFFLFLQDDEVGLQDGWSDVESVWSMDNLLKKS